MIDPKEHHQLVRAQVRRIQSKMLDRLEAIVDGLAEPEIPPPSPEVARRCMANRLGLWRTCAHRLCQRSRCCKGEPLHCLRVGIWMLPEGALDGLLASRRGQKFIK